MSKKKKEAELILVALFSAIISVGCFIIIPIPGGIPIVVQDMMALLAGLLLGPVYGSASVLVFLLLGCIGLPVFSGKAGINVLTQGFTRGFLFGYLFAAFVAGLLLCIFLPQNKKHKKVKELLLITIVTIISTVILFAFGFVGFKTLTHSTFIKTLGVTVIPFIPGSIIKIIITVLIVKRFRPIIYRYIN